jgi:ATP-dependent helicase/nuclease subunit A
MNPIHIITASAGSGKTYRLCGLLHDRIADKTVRPEAVIATTFTKKAAAELQERVRQRLIAKGLTGEANRLAAARMGTVNFICSRLVMDFAFEKGLFPETVVLDETDAKRELKRAVSSVMTGSVSSRFADLKTRLVGFEWANAVKSVINSARNNGLNSQLLEITKQRSIETLLELLGDPLGPERDPETELKTALADFLQNVDTTIDTTKVTALAVQQATACLNLLEQGRTLSWADWLRLDRLGTGKKSADHVGGVNQAAALHDRHPKLREDLREAVALVFDTAIRAIDAYQDHKRAWGVMDFSDQEVLALDLLKDPAVQDQLKGSIDILLVDEFQDTSPIQLAILLKLASLSKETVWVGDQKQSIYGFRGTDPALMDACIEHIFRDRAPETLDKSWRSRPPLVDMTSDIFARAFEAHDIPKERVTLEAALKSDPPELDHSVEWWELQTKKNDHDASAIAAGVQSLLRNAQAKIRDPETGEVRQTSAGDMGILCRTNEFCSKVAGELEKINIRAVLPRAGLMRTPEAMVLVAGLRLWVDPKDSLAAAEVARILHYFEKPEQWLADLLENPDRFASLPEVQEILETAGENPDSGVHQTLDAVYRITRIREVCLSWGDAAVRLANLDAFMAHAVKYIEYAATEGIGCTPAGLVAHLHGLGETGDDTQALLAGDDAVTVVTYHGAKGLEWPVTIMTQIGKTFEPNPLGVKVIHEKAFNMDDPLADRWLRYWLFPYHPSHKNTLFQYRMGQHPSNEAIVRQHERQELRVLYVGWTRARDRLILAGRPNQFEKGMLGLLKDEKGDWLLSRPENGKACWAGKDIDVKAQVLSPVEPEVKEAAPGEDYPLPEKSRTHPPARLSPSPVEGQGKVLRIDDIGKRIPISGNPDMDRIGNAFHAFFAADRLEFDHSYRINLATGIVRRWQVSGAIDPKHLVEASDNLRAWADRCYPNAIWRREWPVTQRLLEGTIVSGYSDLVLEAENRFAIVDHKAFPGNRKDAGEKATEFSGQLKSYRDILKAQYHGAEVSCYIHYPIVGILVEADAKC